MFVSQTPPIHAEDDRLKARTAKTVKWNLLDRFSSQVLYAVTGIVLANTLDAEAFGLVGALLVFQAFASLFVDSGFSFALIQRKQPTKLDYSSVLWFNLLISIVLYIILFFSAPLIARCYHNNEALIPLSRVLFLTFIFNAAGIVQTNIMMKKMEVKYVAVSNCVGLAVGGAVGIWMAFRGFGAWALVWQYIVAAAVKTAVLWIAGKWLPLMECSFKAIASFWKVSSRMMMSSFLNVLFQNVFAFFVGVFSGMKPLGYYTQSDKWSKMGVTAVSQTLTASFLPALSAVQDDRERYRRVSSKMTRFTAFITFPAMIWLAVMAEPIFHLLFGSKWDPSIILFQLLLLRGIFLILNTLYTNILLGIGKANRIVWLEFLRDGVSLAVLFVTLPYINLSSAESIVFGLEIMLWAQVGAAFLTWIVTLIVTARGAGLGVFSIVKDLLPYLALSLLPVWPMILSGSYISSPLLILCAQVGLALILYLVPLKLLGSTVLKDAIGYIKPGKK